MTTPKAIYIIMLGLSLFGCANIDLNESNALEPKQVSLVEGGSSVRVRGYLVFESHARQLWSSERASRRNDIENCVTLINTRQHQELLRRRSRSIVTVIGIANRDVTTGYVDLGACNRVGVSVEAIEG